MLHRSWGWKLLGIVAVLAAAAAAGALFWQTTNRLKEVEARLGLAEQRSQTVLRQMTAYSRELELALQRARDARQHATASEALRAEAVSRADAAEGAAAQSQKETQQAREQLDEVRRRRDQELDRMRQALNQIAPTRRTPLGMVVELANDSFKFDFDKASLRPENREMLSRVAGVLLASSGYRLQVYGYTDDIGTDDYNHELSERRAQAVAEYLIKAGVPADIISTTGYGKTSPRVSGTTKEARQQNRRVEIGVVDTVISYHGANRQP